MERHSLDAQFLHPSRHPFYNTHAFKRCCLQLLNRFELHSTYQRSYCTRQLPPSLSLLLPPSSSPPLRSLVPRGSLVRSLVQSTIKPPRNVPTRWLYRNHLSGLQQFSRWCTSIVIHCVDSMDIHFLTFRGVTLLHHPSLPGVRRKTQQAHLDAEKYPRHNINDEHLNTRRRITPHLSRSSRILIRDL